MEQKKVSIIIVNWNGKKIFKDCFDSIKKNVYKNYEIIVVDNGSTDGSIEFIKSNYPHIILLENEENLGFAEGNNVGIRYALKHNVDYILLLNNDTTVDKDFLFELVNVAENDPNTGIVGSMVYFMDNPTKICFAGGKRSWTTEWRHIGLDEIDVGQYDKITESDFIYGCALMVKREIIENVGMFDPDYFAYVEETDLNYRVKKAGYKIVFVPTSKVWHKIAASDTQGRISPTRQYYMIRNNLLFLKKNGTSFDLIKFCVFILPKWFMKNVVYLFKSPKIFLSTLKAFSDFFSGRVGRAII